MNHEVFLFFNVSAISAVLKVETDISKFGKTGVTKIVVKPTILVTFRRWLHEIILEWTRNKINFCNVKSIEIYYVYFS